MTSSNIFIFPSFEFFFFRLLSIVKVSRYQRLNRSHGALTEVPARLITPDYSRISVDSPSRSAGPFLRASTNVA